MSLILGYGRQRQVDLCNFEANLVLGNEFQGSWYYFTEKFCLKIQKDEEKKKPYKWMNSNIEVYILIN